MNGRRDLPGLIQERFLEELRHHLGGWAAKISSDFSEKTYRQELANLTGDPVYRAFGFATPEYVVVRLIGRVSISIGRRLGEIYDKILRFVVQTRFNLAPEDVSAKVGKLLLDVRIPHAKLSPPDQEHVWRTVRRHLPAVQQGAGLGIEVRYNFNPNDSSRLRKDVSMVRLLERADLRPVYLVFSGISPREEAIARLRRAGWNFLIGPHAMRFMGHLTGMDLVAILERPAIRREVDQHVATIMGTIFESHAFRQVRRARG